MYTDIANKFILFMFLLKYLRVSMNFKNGNKAGQQEMSFTNIDLYPETTTQTVRSR